MRLKIRMFYYKTCEILKKKRFNEKIYLNLFI